MKRRCLSRVRALSATVRCVVKSRASLVDLSALVSCGRSGVAWTIDRPLLVCLEEYSSRAESMLRELARSWPWVRSSGLEEAFRRACRAVGRTQSCLTGSRERSLSGWANVGPGYAKDLVEMVGAVDDLVKGVAEELGSEDSDENVRD